MPRLPKIVVSLLALSVGGFAFSGSIAHADPTEGRPTALAPVGANVAQAATEGGASYETMRIKRTVKLDPALGVAGQWDSLYAVQDTSGGTRTTYLDWDDTFLYVAVETASPVETRLDIDGKNDGWLRGADNLRIDVKPAPDGTTDAPLVTALRFDTEQNREMPVWAASPIAVGDIKAAGGKTPRGTYVVMLAIPQTEKIGLMRKNGTTFGMRTDTGAPTLSPTEGEAVNVPIRPLLRVTLAEAVLASTGGLNVQLLVDGPRDIAPGGNVKVKLEIKNTGQAEKTLQRVFIRGTLGGTDFVDERKFAGTTIAPGKSIKRDLESTVSPNAPIGSLVLTGGGELDDGTTVAGLTAFNKIEPYTVWIEADSKPIPATGENGGDPVSSVKVFVRSHVNAHVTAAIQIKLPLGWKMAEDSTALQDRALVRDGDVQFAKFRFSVPVTSGLGSHLIDASVTISGHTYNTGTSVTIAQ